MTTAAHLSPFASWLVVVVVLAAVVYAVAALAPMLAEELHLRREPAHDADAEYADRWDEQVFNARSDFAGDETRDEVGA